MTTLAMISKTEDTSNVVATQPKHNSHSMKKIAMMYKK